MKITEGAGGIIINDKGEVVVAKQTNIHVPWSLPKGHVEPGEDFLDAAKREIYEETGLTKLEFVKELPVYERFMKDKNGIEDLTAVKRLHFYLFKTEEKELKPIDADNPEARWVPKNEVVDLLSHEKDKEFFRSIVDEI